ncbi:unnamed protein product [Triticum aestivum]|uniref:Uncharacterized protein n=1 Tax=Triticum aestivum TaxID=4565 RepID=A0A7H4LJJ4_WHEAT|nr:uncharacterized protein LOC109756693 [Aegilops tauschii subsp. strangulata]SPT18782.1 unnamed protein product [Triticum aestivum]
MALLGEKQSSALCRPSIERRTTGPANRSPARTAARDSRTGGSPKGPPSRCSTRHGGGAGPEVRGASESVGQELGGALHHCRRLGRDAVPIEAVWGGRRGAGGGGGKEV